jgi:GNAT superfamily N-acetyltransferase
MNMPIHLRPFIPTTDIPRLAELMSAVETAPTTAEMLHEWEANAPAGQLHRRMIAHTAEGQIVGYSQIQHQPWMPPGEYYLWLLVDPAWQQQTIGQTLYDDALAFLATQQATTIKSKVRDDMPGWLHFAQQRGFSIDRHLFESTLDLAYFDETPLAGTIEAIEATGIRFLTLADLGNSEATLRCLYDFNRRTAADMPGSDGAFPTFEEFRTFVFDASWYRPDGQLIAADGDTWVAIATVGAFPHDNSMYNAYTSVERAYRGRRIALALKLLAIRFARRHAAATIRTNNDSQNSPMLAINQKLGYHPQPGSYQLIKTLA